MPWDNEQAQRATRSAPLEIRPAFSSTFSRFISWRGDEPQPIAITTEVLLTYGTTSTLGLPAGASYQDLSGRITARYGWGAWGSSFTIDLRSGTFALPACDNCEISIEAASPSLRNLPDDIGAIHAAIVPYASGNSDRLAYSYQIQTSANKSGELLLEPVDAPPRATSYRAWLSDDRREQAYLLTTATMGESREWKRFGSPDATLFSQLGEQITPIIRGAEAEQNYTITLQFYISP